MNTQVCTPRVASTLIPLSTKPTQPCQPVSDANRPGNQLTMAPAGIAHPTWVPKGVSSHGKGEDYAIHALTNSPSSSVTLSLTKGQPIRDIP